MPTACSCSDPDDRTSPQHREWSTSDGVARRPQRPQRPAGSCWRNRRGLPGRRSRRDPALRRAQRAGHDFATPSLQPYRWTCVRSRRPSTSTWLRVSHKPGQRSRGPLRRLIRSRRCRHRRRRSLDASHRPSDRRRPCVLQTPPLGTRDRRPQQRSTAQRRHQAATAGFSSAGTISIELRGSDVPLGSPAAGRRTGRRTPCHSLASLSRPATSRATSRVTPRGHCR